MQSILADLLDPIIFRGLKSLTLDDSQQQSLLRLAQEGISVYSPHTAVDSVPEGMADWLCDVVTGAIFPLSENSSLSAIERSPAHKSNSYSQPAYPRPPQRVLASAEFIPHVRKTIHPSPSPVPEGFESAGAGRLVTFANPQLLTSIIDRIANCVGNPAGIAVAIPQSTSADALKIRTIGICPGSGSSVLLSRDRNDLADLIFTGELSHHDALAVIEHGSAVVALNHSNTERGYLHAGMRPKLTDLLTREWDQVEEGAGKDVIVDVSERDRDPYGIMIRLA